MYTRKPITTILVVLNLVFICLFTQFMTSQNLKGFNIENAIIPLEDIKDGGPPKDGIPAIDHPKFRDATKSKLKNNSRVLGVFHNGIAKAYPISILNYHEIVNDFFGQDPVAITYCPLCGSGVSFEAKTKGSSTTFGVSGLLYNSDVLLYDRKTESLWSQLMSQSISGPLVGEVLQMINTENTSWGKWKEKHPNTLVLSPDTGFQRDYDKSPYQGYEYSSSLYFSVNKRSALFHPKEMVLGVQVDGKFKAYPFSELKKSEGKVVTDVFQGETLTIVYDISNESAEILDDSDNPVLVIANFWFAWYAFHPETEVYKRSVEKK